MTNDSRQTRSHLTTLLVTGAVVACLLGALLSLMLAESRLVEHATCHIVEAGGLESKCDLLESLILRHLDETGGAT